MYAITDSTTADGIHCLQSSLTNHHAIMMTIKPIRLALHGLAKICITKKEKAPEIRGLISSVCQTAPAAAG
jgi:hypothetical protein